MSVRLFDEGMHLQHWSSRTLWDRKQSLWGGYAIIGKSLRFWFAGDTGYCPVFKEIGSRYGPFDLSGGSP